MNKYQLSEESRLHHWQDGETKTAVKVRQIIAARDFSDVKSGTRGLDR